MATTDLDVTSVIQNSGWTNATASSLLAIDSDVATDGTVNDFISVEITNAPGDFGSQNSIQLHAHAFISGAGSRSKQLVMELRDSAENVLETHTTGDLTTTPTTYSSAVWTRSDSQSVIDGYRYRITVTEGGGMPDSVVANVDRMWGVLDYTSSATFTPETQGFRWYKDDAAEDSSTPLEAEDTDATLGDGAASLPVTSGMVWHLDASEITGLANDDPVATWSDLSAESNDAVQATGANQPIYKTGILNGKPVVRFDGANHYLDMQNLPATPAAGGYEFFVVIANVGAVNTGFLTTGGGTYVLDRDGNATEIASLKFTGSDIVGHQKRDGGGTIGGVASSQAISDASVVSYWRDRGTAYGIRVDGVEDTVADGDGDTSLTPVRIGGHEDLSSNKFFPGDIAEIILYDHALTAQEREDVEGYLSKKWGVNPSAQLRMLVAETTGASGATTDDWQLQVSKNSGAYANVAAASSNVRARTASQLSDGSATTNRATNGISDPASGIFVAGQQEAGDGLIADHQLTADNFTEHVWALTLVAADLTDGDTLDFRVLLNGSPIAATVTPRVTVGAVVPTGEAAQSFQQIAQQGTGTLLPEGVGVSSIGAPSQSASATEEIPGSADQSIATPNQSGDGVLHPEGEAAQALQQVGQAGTATSLIPGDGAQNLAAPTQAGDAVMQPEATGASVLAELAQAGTGLEAFTATGASTIEIVAQAGVGLMHPEGAGDSVLATLSQAGDATVLEPVIGTADQTIAALAQSGAGVEIIAGTGDQSLDTPTQAGAATAAIEATAASTLAALTQAGVGVEAITAAGAQSVASVTQSATGVMPPEGQGDQSLAALAQAGAAVETITSTAAQSLAELAQAGTGEHSEGITGTGASALAPVEQSGTGVGGAVGDADQTIAALAQAGIGVEAMEAAGGQTLQQVAQAGAGAHVEEIAGIGAQSIASLDQNGLGIEVMRGQAAQALLALTQDASGALIVEAAGAQTLERVTQTADGRVPIAGTAAQMLQALNQLAAADITGGTAPDVEIAGAWSACTLAGAWSAKPAAGNWSTHEVSGRFR